MCLNKNKKRGECFMNNNTFCENCRKDVPFSIKENTETHHFKGDEIEFIETVALCNQCGNEVFVAEFMDASLKALYDAYRIKNNIISLEHICEIPVKYAIGKRPLSLLLEWGELTFTRYCDGDMPTKQYAGILKRIYDEPAYFLSILESNKDTLKSSSYLKSKIAVQKLLGEQVNVESKLNSVIKYILSKCDDMTNLTLQKSLYYIQGFYNAFHNAFIFEDDCEAWIYGPVYKEIYRQYSNYGFDSIDSENDFDDSCFSADEKILIDSIIKYFCCYSGNTLIDITHRETPWLKTRGDLPSNVQSNRIITKDLIKDYFTAVKDKYNILTPADIKVYSTTMFNNL